MACPRPPWLGFRAMWISVGVFDSADLVQVFQTGEYEDGIADNSSYEEGDWNGDGDFDSADLVAMFQSSHYEAQINRRVERAASVRPTWGLDSALRRPTTADEDLRVGGLWQDTIADDLVKSLSAHDLRRRA